MGTLLMGEYGKYPPSDLASAYEMPHLWIK